MFFVCRFFILYAFERSTDTLLLLKNYVQNVDLYCFGLGVSLYTIYTPFHSICTYNVLLKSKSSQYCTHVIFNQNEPSSRYILYMFIFGFPGGFNFHSSACRPGSLTRIKHITVLTKDMHGRLQSKVRRTFCRHAFYCIIYIYIIVVNAIYEAPLYCSNPNHSPEMDYYIANPYVFSCTISAYGTLGFSY